MAFSKNGTVNIDHTKVPNTDQINFPVLFSVTHPFLKTTGNGGFVTNANAFDVNFFSDSGLTTKLSWEVEFYDGVAGTLIAWVKIASVSHTVDTPYYVGVGDATITTFQGNVNGTWDSNFQRVWHLPNGTSLSANDSTVNANNGTINGATAVAGAVDGAASFVSASSQYIDMGASNTALSGQDSFTIEFFLKPTTLSVGQMIVSQWVTALAFIVQLDNTDPTSLLIATNDASSGFGVLNSAPGTLTAGTRNYIAITWASLNIPLNTTFWNVYKDGTPTGVFNTVNSCAAIRTSTDHLQMGAIGNAVASNFLNGVLDEVRISKSIRSADWIKTTFNTTNSPSTFSTLTFPAAGGSSATFLMMGV